MTVSGVDPTKQRMMAEMLSRQQALTLPTDPRWLGATSVVFALLVRESGKLDVIELAYAADESAWAKREINQINLELPKQELAVEQNRADMKMNGMIETGISLGTAAVEAGVGVALISSGAGAGVGVLLVISASAKILNKIAGAAGAYDWLGQALKPEAEAKEQRELGNKIQQAVTYGELGLSIATLPLAGSSAIAEGAKWAFKMESAAQVFGGMGYSYFGIIRTSTLKGKEQELQAVIVDMSSGRAQMESLQQAAALQIQESGKSQVDLMKAASEAIKSAGKARVYENIAAAAA
jgi:hypothetical protein